MPENRPGRPTRTRSRIVPALAAITLLAAGYPATATAAAPAAAPATVAGAERLADADAASATPRGGVPTLAAHVVASGLTNPWDVAFTPDRRMIVSERPGRLRVYADGNVGSALQLTFTLPGVWAQGEAGLLGIAVDRAFADTGMLYACLSRSKAGSPVNQVVAYRLAGSTLTFDHWVIRNGMDAASIHNGCALEHGPDGKLWVTMGDAADPESAQDPRDLNGKVLRVGTDGSIPTDNPVMPGAVARTAVYAMGLRNPQGIAFQPVTQRPYTVEHGPDRDDEVNWIRAGHNYGWPCYTGANIAYDTAGCGPAADYTPSVWASGSPTIATSGAAFMDHTRWGAWNGSLFVSTLKQSDLRRLEPQSATSFAMASTLFDGTYGRLRAAVKGPGARLYLTTSNGTNDRVIRVAAQP